MAKVSNVTNAKYSSSDESIHYDSSLPVLSVRNLKKSFNNGKIHVFDGVSFDVCQGESIALIGANGTGKSTLLRSCLRLIEPDSGSASFNGQNIHTLCGKQLRQCRSRVGFIFQKHNLVPRLSVLSNVIHGAIARGHGVRCWMQGFAPEEEREKALKCLNMVELTHLADRRADRLSGGQSQRVAIARALMQEPDFIFADEPVASLDPVAGQGIMELFQRLNKEQNIPLVFVSHQLSHAIDYADRILGLKNNTLHLDTPSKNQDIKVLREIYE